MKGDAASGLACAARWGRSGRGVGAGRVLGAGVAALGRGWAGRGRAGWAGRVKGRERRRRTGLGSGVGRREGKRVCGLGWVWGLGFL